MVSEPVGHTDISTTMIFTHVPNRGGHGVWRPVAGFSHGLCSLYETGADGGP